MKLAPGTKVRFTNVTDQKGNPVNTSLEMSLIGKTGLIAYKEGSMYVVALLKPLEGFPSQKALAYADELEVID